MQNTTASGVREPKDTSTFDTRELRKTMVEAIYRSPYISPTWKIRLARDMVRDKALFDAIKETWQNGDP